jgi:hypothetical protein
MPSPKSKESLTREKLVSLVMSETEQSSALAAFCDGSNQARDTIVEHANDLSKKSAVRITQGRYNGLTRAIRQSSGMAMMALTLIRSMSLRSQIVDDTITDMVADVESRYVERVAALEKRVRELEAR